MPYPQVRVSTAAAKRLRHHDCWVFRDELADHDPLPHGEVVELTDERGTFLAYAFASAHSHIAARVLSNDRAEPPDRAFFSRTIAAAIARRSRISQTNAKRLIFSEADNLPGLIVDQYADFLVLQSRTAGMERWKSDIVRLLQEALRPKGILERSDKEFREDEGLAPLTQVLHGTVPERIRIEEEGLAFWVDPYKGQKTGFYLDQRDTRRWVRSRIQPGERVADVCAYTGGFGIGAAQAGAQVVCVEQQEPFLELAKEHARLNGVEGRMSFVAGDAFYWLEAKAKSRERFDWMLLDPPSLAKSKADILKGRQALHHLVVNALGALTEDGRLVLSVCTYHLLGLVEEILRIAAAEHGERLRVLAVTRQAEDHPWILQRPMTRYLMSWVVRKGGRS